MLFTYLKSNTCTHIASSNFIRKLLKFNFEPRKVTSNYIFEKNSFLSGTCLFPIFFDDAMVCVFSSIYRYYWIV